MWFSVTSERTASGLAFSSPHLRRSGHRLKPSDGLVRQNEGAPSAAKQCCWGSRQWAPASFHVASTARFRDGGPDQRGNLEAHIINDTFGSFGTNPRRVDELPAASLGFRASTTERGGCRR